MNPTSPDARPLPHEGPLPGADAVGESGSMSCGPGVRVALGLDAEGRVVRAAFETVAFDAARPVASRVCEALLGRTVEGASRVTLLDVAALAGLPVRDAVVRTVHFAKSAALLPVLGRGARHGPEVTCTCFLVRTDAIRRSIRRHRIATFDGVRDRTKAGAGCGTCRPDVERLLAEERAAR